MDEQKKYEVIKALADHPNGNKDRAALTLGCTKRHINRMLAGYRREGKAFFVHGNRGRKPATTIPEETRNTVVDLYRNKYYQANFRHYTELLEERENIRISPSSVAKILEAESILSPRVTKARKKRIKKELLIKKENASSKKEADAIQANLVAVEDAHSRRPRCAYFGEMQQMDASPYEWVPGQTWHLHLAIDDATGTVTGAWFDTQETLSGYYHVFHQILTNYGIPYQFFTDRRTIFTYKQKNSPSLDEDTYTQFAYACKQLGVLLESSSVPQAKGRVERLNQTLQSRLPVELRLAGITTIEGANEFLHSYIKKFNAKFSLPSHNTKSVFEMQPTDEKINAKFSLPIHHTKSVFVEQPSDETINLILAVLNERTVDCGHCIRFQNQHYRMLDNRGLQVHYRNGTKTMVIQAFDGSLYCCVNDKEIYALEKVPERYPSSKNLDAEQPAQKPKKKYIPPMNHPWRRSAFRKFVQNQPHRLEDHTVA